MVADVLQMKADTSANRLYTIFRGQIQNASLQQAMPEYARLLGLMRPGFCLITDLTSVESMDLGCEPTIGIIMDLSRTHGVGMVVRVVPDPRKDIGFNILGRFHYGADVRTVTCETREEAEQVINA